MFSSQSPANPFVLMMDPGSVFRALESSDRLSRLQRRVCRPLDKPLIPKIFDAARDFDAVIEAEEFMDSGAELYMDAQPALQTVH